MLLFLRNIRRKLLGDQRFKKYLLYAIGEITLVVIGILIAVSVNDWNQDRKDNTRRMALLQALEFEFRSNLEQLEEIMTYQGYILDAAFKSQKMIKGGPLLADDQLDTVFQSLSYIWTFDPRNGALRSGISSGDIHMIRNDSLLNLLFSWEDVIRDLAENEDRAELRQLNAQLSFSHYLRQARFMTVFIPALGGSAFPSDIESLLRDPTFEDYITWRIVDAEDCLAEYKDVHQYNLSILRHVRGELEKM